LVDIGKESVYIDNITTKGNRMDERFKEITDIIGQIENKLDLMLDLINAKNNENWDLVDEIHAKMDEMRSKNS